MSENGTFRHYEDIESFDRLYRKMLSESDTNKQAYHRVEQRFKQRFGKRRYCSFDSFKNAYSRRHKK